VRHFNVAEDEVGPQGLHFVQRIQAVVRQNHVHAFPCQQTPCDAAHGDGVVYDQNGDLHGTRRADLRRIMLMRCRPCQLPAARYFAVYLRQR